jgi:DNA-binding MarR family transcriptional regulator
MQLHLYKLLRSFESCDQHCLAQYGITASQGYALLAFPMGSDTSMNELSRAMGLANSTMTRMVENLVTKDLVHRWQDDQDRRVVRVTLTSRGEELQRALKEARRELQRRIFAEVQEGERPGILDALEKLSVAVEKIMRSCCSE